MDRYALKNRKTGEYVKSVFRRTKDIGSARVYSLRTQKAINAASWWDSSQEDWMWVKVRVVEA